MRKLDLDALLVGQRVICRGNGQIQDFVGMVIQVRHSQYTVLVKHPVSGDQLIYHYADVELYD